MLIDIAIIIFGITAWLRGRDAGLVRQLCSTVGFFVGLFIGAALEPHTVSLVHSQSSRTVVTITTTLGCALIGLIVGEYFGLNLKQQVSPRHINSLDTAFGGIVGVMTMLSGVWLTAAVINAAPFPNFQTALHNSRIVRGLDRALPQAPNVIAHLGHLIDPNGFPQVFVGTEPNPPANIKLPTLGQMQVAVKKDEVSVVKVEGQGCGGTVEGSGFVVNNNLVATNAHVIAGIKQPNVADNNGVHKATAVWFDPNLDLAILQVNNLAGSALTVANTKVPAGTASAIMGYPGGGGLQAGTAAVLEEFSARGRNIYGSGNTIRDVNEVQADIIPGNSGGPLIDVNGIVIGVVFAESTTYQHVGYTLTAPEVSKAIHQAEIQQHPVGTGQCAD